jgi:hypothetical protein
MFGTKAVNVLLVTLLICACSGNDGRAPTTPETPEQPEPPVLSCAMTEGAVFIDETCADWQDPSVFEQSKTELNSFAEFDYGTPSNLVTQQIIDSENPAHGEVWDVQYGPNPNYNGLPRFRSIGLPVGNDMSEYNSGKLIFDLKVIKHADDTDKIFISIPCGWPCNSTDRVIPVRTLNKWETYEVPVEELIRDGLNVANVEMGLQIFPTWGSQSNAHFQVDNIRWQKGSAPATTKKCFAQHFDQFALNYKLAQVSQPNELLPWPVSVPASVRIQPQWATVDSTWGFSVMDHTDQLTLDLCSMKGVLTASVSVAEAYVEDGHMNVGLYFVDNIGTFYPFPSVSVASLSPKDWNTLSVNLPANPPYSWVTQVGVYFEQNGKPANVEGEIIIDNLVITHPL